jgi:hypothetical protein
LTCPLFIRILEEEAAERTLEGADAERWQEALQGVQALGFEEVEADSILRKAFGWSGQGYWRKSKEYEVPQSGQVRMHACMYRFICCSR